MDQHHRAPQDLLDVCTTAAGVGPSVADLSNTEQDDSLRDEMATGGDQKRIKKKKKLEIKTYQVPLISSLLRSKQSPLLFFV